MGVKLEAFLTLSTSRTVILRLEKLQGSPGYGLNLRYSQDGTFSEEKATGYNLNVVCQLAYPG